VNEIAAAQGKIPKFTEVQRNIIPCLKRLLNGFDPFF
jgi:hypothetical protein